MHELAFRPAPFEGHLDVELDDELDSELSAGDRLQLARSVVIALIRGAGERDVTRLTNVAFHIHHPDRPLQQKLDPAREPKLAAEWTSLKASVVAPALQDAVGARPATGLTGKVLLVGDSHTDGAFGAELARLLEAGGARVVRKAKIGSAVKYWLPLVPGLLREHRPTTVVIALGANMRDYPSASGTSAQIRKLVEVVRAGAPGARVIWIGPPRQKSDTEQTLQRFNAIIRAGIDRDTVFLDSAPHTPTYRGGDGVHYADGAAKDWARGISTQMTR